MKKQPVFSECDVEAFGNCRLFFLQRNELSGTCGIISGLKRKGVAKSFGCDGVYNCLETGRFQIFRTHHKV